MARTNLVQPFDTVPARALEPVVVSRRPAMVAVFDRLRSWGDSLAVRGLAMAAIDFPLSEDIPAFLLFTQVTLHGAARPTDLAAALGTGRSNVTKIVNRLEGVGLLARAAAPDDDRAVVVYLTESGRELGHRLVTRADEVVEDLLARWPDDEARELVRLVGKFTTSLESVARPSPPR